VYVLTLKHEEELSDIITQNIDDKDLMKENLDKICTEEKTIL